MKRILVRITALLIICTGLVMLSSPLYAGFIASKPMFSYPERQDNGNPFDNDGEAKLVGCPVGEDCEAYVANLIIQSAEYDRNNPAEYENSFNLVHGLADAGLITWCLIMFIVPFLIFSIYLGVVVSYRLNKEADELNNRHRIDDVH